MYETKEKRQGVISMANSIESSQKEIDKQISYWKEIVEEMKKALNIIAKPISNKYKTSDHTRGILIDDRKNPHIWLTFDGELLEVYLENDNEVTKTNKITIEHVFEHHEQYDTSTWLDARFNALKNGMEELEKKKKVLSGIPSNLKPVG